GAGEDDARTGDLDIRSSITIGPAAGTATVRGSNSWNDRIFDIFAPASATQISVQINRLQIQNGNADIPGGGIRNNLSVRTVSIADSTVSDLQFRRLDPDA